MYRIGGRAHARGISFESDIGRVFAADNGKDTFTPFSARSRRIKAALRKVPVLRVFPAFGTTGTVIFLLIVAMVIVETFAPWLLSFELYIRDEVFYILLAAAAVVLVLAAVMLRGRVRHTLQYHGAEHMVLNVYRAGKPLTSENIAKADRANPNCGSLFVLVFIIVGVPLMIVPYSDYFLPVTLGVAFELTVLARRAKWLRWLLRFGLWSQRKIWTRPPDDAQIEVARRGLVTLIEMTGREIKKA